MILGPTFRTFRQAFSQIPSGSTASEAVIGFPDEFRPFVSHLPDFFGAAFGIYVVCRVILRTLPAKVSYMGVYS